MNEARCTRVLALCALVVAGGCQPALDLEEVDQGASSLVSSSWGNELPWEMVSPQGESILPDVFYAEASQNEQIMPVAIDGHVMIDRLIYPTLGNPNLYDKSDAADSVVVALRLEAGLVQHLHPVPRGPEPGTRLTRVTLDDTATDSLRVVLVSRAARPWATTVGAPVDDGPGVYRLMPTRTLVDPTPADMPAALRQRATYRLLFGREQMANVPAGLYDVRLEIRKQGALADAPASGEPTLEYQYNALRVFDGTADEYPIVSITDTQVSVGSYYRTRTLAKLEEVVAFINASTDGDIVNAPFAVFNGDLHQGGSPAGLSQGFVPPNNVNEARATLDLLKELPLPIFLIPGNHDGYASVGHVPGPVRVTDWFRRVSLQSVVEAAPSAWPDFSWPIYDAWLKDTAAHDQLGGHPQDIFVGAFARRLGTSFAASWTEVPRASRNFILYDGFHQWRRTYGPLEHSWRFRKNTFIGVNSYDLRQHKRMTWSMHAPNYGGGMSDRQLDWLDRELTRADATASDVVLLAHHDPRGGHERGEDHGYYFPQVDYQGIHQALHDGVDRYVWGPLSCNAAPLTSVADADECEHVGKQTWMAPDPIFDGATAGSGPRLLARISRSRRLRTLLLGHTHHNSLEMLQAGDALVPGVSLAVGSGGAGQRELMVLELVSAADATLAKHNGQALHGFQVLHVTASSDSRAYALPQINGASYSGNAGGGAFQLLETVTFDRSARVGRADPANPVNSVFE